MTLIQIQLLDQYGVEKCPALLINLPELVHAQIGDHFILCRGATDAKFKDFPTGEGIVQGRVWRASEDLSCLELTILLEWR